MNYNQSFSTDDPDLLIIGYGNTLRSDDGIGQKVAQEVETWCDPQVRSLYVHQLTPELSADMAIAKTVIFVDAVKMDEQFREIELRKVTSLNTEKGFTHHSSPQSLLYLTQQLYSQSPTVWLLLIPVINFDFGEEFSAIAKQNLEIALHQIKAFITNYLET
jgi:hydrogenase maturation protease